MQQLVTVLFVTGLIILFFVETFSLLVIIIYARCLGLIVVFD